jgi:hypothetical protein
MKQKNGFNDTHYLEQRVSGVAETQHPSLTRDWAVYRVDSRPHLHVPLPAGKKDVSQGLQVAMHPRCSATLCERVVQWRLRTCARLRAVRMLCHWKHHVWLRLHLFRVCARRSQVSRLLHKFLQLWQHHQGTLERKTERWQSLLIRRAWESWRLWTRCVLRVKQREVQRLRDTASPALISPEQRAQRRVANSPTDCSDGFQQSNVSRGESSLQYILDGPTCKEDVSARRILGWVQALDAKSKTIETPGLPSTAISRSDKHFESSGAKAFTSHDVLLDCPRRREKLSTVDVRDAPDAPKDIKTSKSDVSRLIRELTPQRLLNMTQPSVSPSRHRHNLTLVEQIHANDAHYVSHETICAGPQTAAFSSLQGSELRHSRPAPRPLPCSPPTPNARLPEPLAAGTFGESRHL